EIHDVLSGNLCRCTGYRPIVDAAQAMFDLPRPAFDALALIDQLQALRRDVGLDYRHAGQRFLAPRTLPGLARLRLEHPDARLLAGSPDIGLWVTKQLRELPLLIYVGQVAELRAIRHDGHALYIGAGATLNEAYDALLRHY